MGFAQVKWSTIRIFFRDSHPKILELAIWKTSVSVKVLTDQNMSDVGEVVLEDSIMNTFFFWGYPVNKMNKNIKKNVTRLIACAQ